MAHRLQTRAFRRGEVWQRDLNTSLDCSDWPQLPPAALLKMAKCAPKKTLPQLTNTAKSKLSRSLSLEIAEVSTLSSTISSGVITGGGLQKISIRWHVAVGAQADKIISLVATRFRIKLKDQSFYKGVRHVFRLQRTHKSSKLYRLLADAIDYSSSHYGVLAANFLRLF